MHSHARHFDGVHFKGGITYVIRKGFELKC